MSVFSAKIKQTQIDCRRVCKLMGAADDKSRGFHRQQKEKVMKNVNNDLSELFRLLLQRASVCNLVENHFFYAERDFCLSGKVKLSKHH